MKRRRILDELLWSVEILKETERALVEKRGLDSVRADSRVPKMDAAFEGAEVSADESLASQMTCHEKDRHVLASAGTGDADVLVISTSAISRRRRLNPTE